MQNVRLDVRPLVIVPHELLAVEGEVVEHLLPEPACCTSMNALKGNVGGRSMAQQ